MLDLVLQHKKYWLECLEYDVESIESMENDINELEIKKMSEPELIKFAKQQDTSMMEWTHQGTLGAIEAINRIILELESK